MKTIAFEVTGPPVPWQRASRGNGKTFVPPESKAYRNHAAIQAMLAIAHWKKENRGAEWVLSKDAEYVLTLRVVFPDRRRRDISNVTKQLEDAWNGVLYKDDSQIAELHVTREYDARRPRVEVELTWAAKQGSAT